MCSPSAPDTSKQDAVAASMQKLNEDQFNWVKQQWEADAPNRAAATQTAQEVSQAQIDQMHKAGALADESAGNYRRVYQPLEEQAAREAASFDSSANQNAAAGRAVADVNQQADIQRAAAARNLASMGVNASDGAAAAADAELRNQQVMQGAGAANNAREQVKTVGRALRADAIGVGRGVVGSQGTQAGLALTAGAQGLGSATVPSQMNTAGVGMVNQGLGVANQGLGGAANIYQNSSKLATDGNDSKNGAMAGLAGAAMTAAAIF